MLSAMGMDAFADRARRELLATGEKVRKRSVETFEELTPQEAHIARLAADGQAPATVPVGFTTFPGEIWKTPRSWVEKAYPNVVYFHEVDRGGHFAAWEEPQLFSEEMRACFQSLRPTA